MALFRFASKLVALAVALSACSALASASESVRHNANHLGSRKHLTSARNAFAMDANSSHWYNRDATHDEKRAANARFTNFEPGENACGGTSSSSDFIVALNSEEYGNGEQCFKTITISYGGKSCQAQIVDECPGCPFNGLDLSPAVFSFLADINLGVITGDWEYGSGAPPASPSPSPSPSPASKPSTSSTPPPPPSTSSTSSSRVAATPSTTSVTNTSSTAVTSNTSSSAASEPSFPPESNNLEALGLSLIQLAGFVVAGQLNPSA